MRIRLVERVAAHLSRSVEVFVPRAVLAGLRRFDLDGLSGSCPVQLFVSAVAESDDGHGGLAAPLSGRTTKPSPEQDNARD